MIKESDSVTKRAGQSNRKKPVSSRLPKGQDGKGIETANLSGAEKDVEMTTDSPPKVESEKPVKENSGGNSLESTRASQNKDEGSKSLPADKDEIQHPVTSVEHEPDNSAVQNRACTLSPPFFSSAHLCI